MLKRATSLFLLGSIIAVAGCAPSSTGGESGSPRQDAFDPDKVLGARWQAMFAEPARVVAAANEFGYKAGPWKTAGSSSGYGTKGIEQVLPGPDFPVRVTTEFEATGPAHLVDTIKFRFVLFRAGLAETKKARDAVNFPRRIMGGFLSRFGVDPGDDVRRALMGGASVKDTRHGRHIVAHTEPLAGKSGYTTVVTLTRN